MIPNKFATKIQIIRKLGKNIEIFGDFVLDVPWFGKSAIYLCR